MLAENVYAGRVVFAYALIWLLEGAFRKWGPGGFDSILYFLRDAFLAVAAAVFCLTARAIRRTPLWIPVAESIFGLVAALQIISGHLSPQVALVGVRQYVSPLMFIHFAVRYASNRQMERVSTLLIVFVPIQCSIAMLQVLSPAASWINTVGNDEYTSFFTADGVVRASGTFTAAYGLVCYLMLTLAVALARQGTSKATSWGARLALPLILLTSFISGARTTIIFTILAVLAQAFMALNRPTARRALVRAIVAIFLGGLLAVWAAPNVLAAFQSRSEDAERTQSTSDRFKIQMFRFTQQVDRVTFLGDGLGTHSAGGIAAGSGQDWIEDELGRWMREAGYVGVVAVLVRELSIPVVMIIGYRTSRKVGSTQAFISCCTLAPNLAGGLLNTQPTQQGFAALIGASIMIEMYTRERRFDA